MEVMKKEDKLKNFINKLDKAELTVEQIELLDSILNSNSDRIKLVNNILSASNSMLVNYKLDTDDSQIANQHLKDFTYRMDFNGVYFQPVLINNNTKKEKIFDFQKKL
jgi:small-conductance mechanosensitive channel